MAGQVGFFLSDAVSEGTGFQVIPRLPGDHLGFFLTAPFLQVIPRSHEYNLLHPDGSSTLADPELLPGAPGVDDAISVQAQAGDAVFFDRERFVLSDLEAAPPESRCTRTP